MKYVLTDTTKVVEGRTLYQIKACKSFAGIAEGTLGGWIENERNLSQEGDAWIYDNAWVFGGARVYGNAWVFGSARVYGSARIYGSARVYGHAWVFGSTQVSGNT